MSALLNCVRSAFLSLFIFLSSFAFLLLCLLPHPLFYYDYLLSFLESFSFAFRHSFSAHCLVLLL